MADGDAGGTQDAEGRESARPPRDSVRPTRDSTRPTRESGRPTADARTSRLTDIGVLRTIAGNAIDHGLSGAASAMAFDVFLGLIPLLALMGAIAGTLARTGKTIAFDVRFLDVAPGPAAELARSHLGRIEDVTGFAPIVICGFLWLSSSGMHVGLATIRHIFGLPARPYARTRLIALGLTIGSGVVAALASGAAVVIHGLAAIGAFSEREHAVWRVVLLTSTVLSTTLVIAAFYRFAGGRAGKQRSYFPGAFLAAVAFHVVSFAFSTYVRTVAKYTAFYGGLAAVAMLMIWLWLSSLMILIGAEANAVLDEERGRASRRR